MSQFATPALVGILITAALLVITNDWRLSFAALVVQYVLMAALIAQIVLWQVTVVKVLVGVLVVGIFSLTGRQANFGRRAGVDLLLSGSLRSFVRFEFPTGLPFRFLAAVMTIVAAAYTASQPGFAFPGLPPTLNVACYALLALGLLNLGLTEEPMNAGMGLLTGLMGFELMYAAVEPSLAIVALLAAVNFGVAMATSYLALLRYAATEKEPPG